MKPFSVDEKTVKIEQKELKLMNPLHVFLETL